MAGMVVICNHFNVPIWVIQTAPGALLLDDVEPGLRKLMNPEYELHNVVGMVKPDLGTRREDKTHD